MSSSTSGGGNYEEPAYKPLFGEPKRRDRVLNLVVGVSTSIAVLITLISAFVKPWPPNGVNVFFAFVMCFICGSHLYLIYWYRQGELQPKFHCYIKELYHIYWYRQGELEPKFRYMIYYNAFTIVLLCICGNLYIHGIANLTTMVTPTPRPHMTTTTAHH